MSIGSPFGANALSGRPVASASVLFAIQAPSSIIGLSSRTLFGRSNGTFGMTGRRATIVSCSGLIRTVSFHPSSVASGGMMMLSHVTRLSTCTSYGVEVDRVRIHAVVRDLPDLRAVVARRRSASTLTSALGSFEASITSVAGVDERVQDDVL